MVKNRTNSTKYFNEFLNEFSNSVPNTPKIPNLSILEIPPLLKLPSNQLNQKKIEEKKKEEEEILYLRKSKNQITFQKYLNRIENDLKNLKEEHFKYRNRRRIFSENTDICFAKKNSILFFLKNRSKNRN